MVKGESPISPEVQQETKTKDPEKTDTEQQAKLEELIKESLDMAEKYREEILTKHSPTARNVLEKFDHWYRYLAMPAYNEEEIDNKATEERRDTSIGIVADLTGKKHQSFSWLLIEDHTKSGKATPETKATIESLTPEEKQLLSNVLECYNNARIERMTDLITFDLLCRDIYNLPEYRRLYAAEINHVKKKRPPEIERRENASRRDQPSFLVSIDFNDFGDINKKISEAVGDQVLVEFSKLLKGLFRREMDKLARPHGDEFKIITRAKSKEHILSHLGKLIEEAKKLSVSYRDDLGRSQIFTGLDVKISMTAIDPEDSPDPRDKSWASPDTRTSSALLFNKKQFSAGKQRLSGVTVVTNDPNIQSRYNYIPHQDLAKTA